LAPSFERRGRKASHPFALSSSPPASTGRTRSHEFLDDSFQTRPRAPRSGSLPSHPRMLRSLQRGNVVERCIRPTSAFQPPTDLYPCSRFSILIGFLRALIEGRDIFTMSDFPPWRVARRRGRFLAALIVSRPFTTSPRTPRHPRSHALWPQRSRSFPACLVKRRALPRSEMSSFGGRWSAAPPYGGSPSGFPKEPSHNGRRSHGLCRPGPTIRRPSRERGVSLSS